MRPPASVSALRIADGEFIREPPVHGGVCTLIFAWRQFDAPVAVAANRDEATARPASPPAVRGANPRVLAPRDEEAGGTWVGYNDRDLFVAVTNRWAGPTLAGERSRGLLVSDALDRSSARAAREFVVGEVADREYGPFHLLLADRDSAFLLSWDGMFESHELPPGLYVIRNVGYTADYIPPHDGKASAESFFTPATERGEAAGAKQATDSRRTREELRPAAEETAVAWLDRAKGILRDHEYGLCVHRDGFGTRSSSAVILGDDARYEYADGKPCEAAYTRVDPEGGL